MTYRPEPATTGPRRRRTLRALLAVPAASAVSAGVGVALSDPASAATTPGAAAAERRRYFGTAVAANKLSDSQYTTILNRDGSGNSVGITVWRNGTNTMPTASCAVS